MGGGGARETVKVFHVHDYSRLLAERSARNGGRAMAAAEHALT